MLAATLSAIHCLVVQRDALNLLADDSRGQSGDVIERHGVAGGEGYRPVEGPFAGQDDRGRLGSVGASSPGDRSVGRGGDGVGLPPGPQQPAQAVDVEPLRSAVHATSDSARSFSVAAWSRAGLKGLFAPAPWWLV
jgi:hypothetical protein